MEDIFRILEDKDEELDKRTNNACIELLRSQEHITLPTEDVNGAMRFIAMAGMAADAKCLDETLLFIGGAFTLLKAAVLETKESDEDDNA